MGFLIDTDIAIHLRDGNASIAMRIAELEDTPSVSVFTLIELEGGVYAVPAKADIRRRRLEAILVEVPVVPFTMNVIRAYATIVRARGFSRPRVIDRLIAATAIVNDLTLVTINAADFRDLPGLRIEAWPPPGQ